MNEEQINKIKEIVREEEKNYNFRDIIENRFNDDDLKNIESLYELRDYLEEINEDNDITNADVIYYSNAIKYLSENDPSLNDSLEIAQEYGYTIDKINSELLASLLMTRNNEEEYSSFIDSVISECEDLFNN